MDRRQSVQSVEIAARVLKTLGGAPSPMSLSHLAVCTELPPAKLHRYLVALVREGLIAQDPVSALYGLGPEILMIGLSALRQIDLVRVSRDVLDAFAAECHETVFLSVWGTFGPTIMMLSEPDRSVSVNVKLGSTLPMLPSSTGRVYLAYLPRPLTERLVDAELAALGAQPIPGVPLTAGDIEALCRDVRANQCAFVDGTLMTGIVSTSTPIYDMSGGIAGALTTLGTKGRASLDVGGGVAASLRRAADEVTRRIGGRTADHDLHVSPSKE